MSFELKTIFDNLDVMLLTKPVFLDDRYSQGMTSQQRDRVLMVERTSMDAERPIRLIPVFASTAKLRDDQTRSFFNGFAHG
jgi:hypothetical protein